MKTSPQLASLVLICCIGIVGYTYSKTPSFPNAIAQTQPAPTKSLSPQPASTLQALTPAEFTATHIRGFPVGLYHVSWDAPSQQQAQDIDAIAEAGFNLIHLSALDSTSYSARLRQADRLGIQIIAEGDIRLPPSSLASRAIANIADDVDNGDHAVAQICEKFQQAKAANPQQLTYISGFSKALGQFTDCADIVAKQVYPIYTGAPGELEETYQSLKQLRPEFADPSRFYANLQAFAWPSSALPFAAQNRAPTPIELRNMTYQALLAGVQGLIYYTYYHKEWYLPDHPALWEELQQLNREVQALSPNILGTPPQILVETPGLVVGQWQGPEKTILIAVNLTQQPQSTTVQFPQQVTRMTEQFARVPFTLAVKGSAIAFHLSPAEVQIFQLQ